MSNIMDNYRQFVREITETRRQIDIDNAISERKIAELKKERERIAKEFEELDDDFNAIYNSLCK